MFRAGVSARSRSTSIAGPLPLRPPSMHPTVHNGRSRRVALAPPVRSVMKYRGARPEATFLGFRPGGAAGV